ncbi:tRNA wybutosine-synthesizing protein 3 homolog isoform X2 [Heterocephalus glaber]|uniref:tRNA wybutosine-synthesizing protein 3 homolog n=1 Tax=Heterocephalus glaber TaxID=10181 RepID=A0AAX6P1F9_HETGA|nr:tRNA wybutosine-synthesizing protein 3 homolog isoform X2 [Heterocephalus glaber]
MFFLLKILLVGSDRINDLYVFLQKEDTAWAPGGGAAPDPRAREPGPQVALQGPHARRGGGTAAASRPLGPWSSGGHTDAAGKRRRRNQRGNLNSGVFFKTTYPPPEWGSKSAMAPQQGEGGLFPTFGDPTFLLASRNAEEVWTWTAATRSKMAAPRDERGSGELRPLPPSLMDRSAEFRRWKAQCLSRADLSRKGSVDEDVAHVVQLLNTREQFFTTSSCAGRILLIDGGINGFEVQKQNCCWLLVTHKPCVKEDVHSVAVDSGFRNSGITVGKKGKTMLAVRSTHGLEVPLSNQGKLMVTEEYIDFLLNIANQKMEENKKRIERFYNCLQHALERETITNSHPKIKEKNNPSCSPKKERNPAKAHGKCTLEENDKEIENDDDDDPGLGVAVFPEDY